MINTNNNSKTNPFYGVEIGSVIRGNTGRFQVSVIEEDEVQNEDKKVVNITRMIIDKHVEQSMTGVSSYIYNDSLNQGFAGVSGSYGLSGLASINSGLSVHVGNSVAELTRKVKINYNVQLVSGIQYINFNQLTVEDLINSLQGNPRDMALDSLDKYNQVAAKIRTANLNLLHILENPDKYPEIIKLVKEWVKSVQNFFSEHGDGMVVARVLGGIGTVSLTMNNKSTENSWKYGTKGNFTYAGSLKSISVEAAYDGSNTNRQADVSVETESWHIGDCVAAQVATWNNTVQGKAFSDISSINVLAQAPKLGDIKPPPAVPAFKTPAKDPKITDKIKEITSLDGLEAFAKAAAYEKARETEPTLTLQKFLERSAKNANPQNVVELLHGISMNDLDVLETNTSLKNTENLETTAVKTATAAAKNNDFTVLGVWITNWSDLFPWMATGYLNQIDDISSTREIIKKQCMIQDFLTLAKTYFMLEATGISHKGFTTFKFNDIAQSFSTQAAYVRENFDNENVIHTAFENLDDDAQKIYTKWNDIKFLRSAELGLGVMHKGKESIKDAIHKPDQMDNHTRIWYKMGVSSFRNGNYRAFSSFLKVVPFITPDGDIYAFGPSQMILNEIKYERGIDGIEKPYAIFSRNRARAAKLEVDVDSRTLKNGDMVFHPIPFDAAKNISSWKGQSVSTNLSSIKNIDSHIANAIKAMKELNFYSFSSSNWNPNWNPETKYSIASIKKQYIGLVNEKRGFLGDKSIN